MNKVLLVGVGPGDPEALTRAAETAIARADVVFAAQRHTTLARDALALEPLADAPDRIRRHLEAGKRVVVLVSGDPCLYSLLGLLRRQYRPGADEGLRRGGAGLADSVRRRRGAEGHLRRGDAPGQQGLGQGHGLGLVLQGDDGDDPGIE